MAWIYLLIAGLMEISWAVALKLSDGFTRPVVSIFTIVLLVLSFIFLSFALKTIAVGTGYAVWTGIGAVGTAIIGMLVLGEPASFIKIFCISLIVAGIIGINLFSR
ncbi:MAG: multidrug efflux SMR transporter [Candidatus Auribacterota bacterium]|nr:multidrug efflux SMR transporter [Candidatus Auribacterota bacterium]